MLISLINASKTVADERVLEVVRAINRQIREDFAPYWHTSATLRLEGTIEGRPRGRALAGLRGDGVIYLVDEPRSSDLLGYHDKNARGVPYGFVYTSIAHELEEDWSVTLSHEALELLADAQFNRLVVGPHPREPKRHVFHWQEVCDAVQAEHYKIDAVSVSNFVLPDYYLPGGVGVRTDFLGVARDGEVLRPFSINPGGYVGLYDPKARKSVTVDADALGRRRRKIREKAGETRRSSRRMAVAPSE